MSIFSKLSKDEENIRKWVNIFDIKENSIITKDGYRIAFFEIIAQPNRDLLDAEEEKDIIRSLASSLKPHFTTMELLSWLFPYDNKKLIDTLEKRFEEEDDEIVKNLIFLDIQERRSVVLADNSIGVRRKFIKLKFTDDDVVTSNINKSFKNLESSFSFYLTRLKLMNTNDIIKIQANFSNALVNY